MEKITCKLCKLATLFLLAVLPTGCMKIIGTETVKGSKTMVDNVYEESGFNEVCTDGQTRVVVTSGEGYSVKAHVPDNLQDYIIIKKKGDRLIVSNKSLNVKCAGKDFSPVVYVTLPTLKGIESNGQSHMTLSGPVAEEFEASASGQSMIDAGDVKIKDAEISTSGQSRIKMGNINASGDVSLSSSGQSNISFKDLNAVEEVSLETSGQASLTGNNLVARDGSVKASGQSSIRINSVSGNFDADVSGQASYRVDR